MADSASCPDSRPHWPHTWSSPKTDGTTGQDIHQCPGVPQPTEE